MKLIEKIQEKYKFERLEDTVLKGHSETIVLQNYELNKLDMHYPLKVLLREQHDGLKTIENRFIIVLQEIGEESLWGGIELFSINHEGRLFNLLNNLGIDEL